ncbi:unnamed protein product [marine sediment metagenome]|uniref:Rho termination factor N-terminal domain-containing protein n=1 Tax=marine sediment metagenome TaxID=412755 RepID=X0S7Z5_9ZZZZ
MLVKFLKQTRNDGESVSSGDTAEVSATTASRWFKNGIAEPADAGAEAVAVEPKTVPLEQQTNAVLSDILEDLGERLPHKIKKATLVDLIKKARARADAGEGGEE